ncbi:MAG: Eco29kI family restriction endonuclease [Spirochaetia bacterium]|nr:Eco29kI family restriction endonuclease [Spirochaetia bacterium]
MLSFNGAGIYAIYYKGDFPLYKKISEKNKKNFVQPIYAGKAIPEGGRKGGFGLDVPVGECLYKRLNEHRQSIEVAENLNIDDFFCRFLVVDDIWIPLGESLLIEKTKPLWNVVVDGFGNHDPGSGRYNQQVSFWDTIHPGRQWAKKLKPGKSKEEIVKLITDSFR